MTSGMTLLQNCLLSKSVAFPYSRKGVRLQEREAAEIRGATGAQAGLHEDTGQPRENPRQGQVPHRSARGNVSTHLDALNSTQK